MIGIIDYNAGNLTSVCNALTRNATEFFVAQNPEELQKATKIIFPGVGHAKSCMQELCQRGFDQFLKTTSRPVLGICVGMQMLFEFSEEGDTKCLGIIEGSVKKFEKEKVKTIPHMGWNTVEYSPSPLFENIPQNTDFYFVHSYYCDPKNKEETLTTTEYENFSFCSAIQKDNFLGVQFHPEKSGKYGEMILENFCGL